MARLRSDVDQIFDQFFRDPFGSMFRGSGGAPAIDLEESDNEVIVTAELPGVDPNGVDIEVNGNTLTIRGEKKQEHEEKSRNYHFVERSFGRFQRTIELPAPVDPDNVEAVARHGTLTIKMLKRPDGQRKRIEVKPG